MAVEHWSETVLLGELGDDPQYTDDLTAIIEQATNNTQTDVLLNFSNVDYLNSSNIAKLLKLRKLVAHDNNRRMILSTVQSNVWGVIRISGLHRNLEIVPDIPSALAAIQEKPQ